MMIRQLEICCGNIESAFAAEAGGAGRIELCAALDQGGVTPSAGMIREVVHALKIPVHVLVRPRDGNFSYSGAEVQCMLRDISVCRDAGAAGIVTGALRPDGSVDKEVCNLLLEAAGPVKCTFHRAFDVAADPFKALEDIIGLGFERILTSGQQPTAERGLVLISQLVKIAGSRIIIMPGSGIHEDNICQIAGQSGAKEFHMSLRGIGQPASREEAILNMPPCLVTDAGRVRKVRELLDTLN